MKKTFFELLRYVGVSIFGYLTVFILMYLLVGGLKLNPQVAYFFTYFVVYVIDYTATLLLVFRKNHDQEKVKRYLAFLVVFFILNNLLFRSFTILGLNYIVAVVGVMVLLFPLKFISSKLVVFK